MITPFSDGGYASGAAALLIGAAFGWFLERAGMGSARKLAGQFYLTDLTVFKVMFTAIVTAMLGVFWLGWIGVIDTANIYVPETFLIPQIVGGVVFGIGFAIAGLCPGTSCVAAATGRIDGFAVVAGMFAGVLGSGILFASLRQFYDLTPRGVLTLPQIFGVSEGLVVFAVVLIAMAGFKVANRIEQRNSAA
ncbi:MAG TPA: YeeE/YedE thiosulfate transporter family protein [Gemmatimonadaceae bacterium]|nr:YeeE/YedE thiosulfate transporter family protein [Gemmatimonadaceae bacterium]